MVREPAYVSNPLRISLQSYLLIRPSLRTPFGPSTECARCVHVDGAHRTDENEDPGLIRASVAAQVYPADQEDPIDERDSMSSEIRRLLSNDDLVRGNCNIRCFEKLPIPLRFFASTMDVESSNYF